MQLYPGDYRRDTAHLNAAQHGAYLLLIMHYWSNDGLPDDDKQLARIACMTLVQFKKNKHVLQKFFQEKWRHKRIDDEIQKAEKKHQVRVNAGHLGGVASSLVKQKSSNAEAMLNHSSEPEPKPEKKKDICAAGAAPKSKGSRLADDWWPSEADQAFASSANLSIGESRHEAEKFRDYWHARAGPGAVKRDWSATWRNWIRNRKGNGNGVETDRERRKRESREALEQLRAFGEGRTDGGFGGSVVQLLPRTGTGGGPEDISSGSG